MPVGRPSFGVDKDGYPIHREVTVLETVKKLRKEGYGWQAITNYLNEQRQLHPRHADRWSRAGLRNLCVRAGME